MKRAGAVRMEDRYLFKAKRTDNEEWVQGCCFTQYERFFIKDIQKSFATTIYNEPSVVDFNVRAYEVSSNTVCQCTGLTDKNGNLIWENDIVIFLDTYSTENGLAEASCIGKVVWDDETLSFQVTGRLSAESYEVLDDCCVIGNIFDNPELLEMGV